MIDKPIIPNDEGFYVCKCEEKFSDVFDFLSHNGIEYEWGVRISRKFTFDMFGFMSSLNDFIRDKKMEDLYESVQSAALTMLNASEGLLPEFMEEVVVAGEMEDVYKGIEKLLKENKDD